MDDYLVPEDLRNKLGSILKEKRESLGYGLNELSRMADISNSLYSKLENGQLQKINPYLIKKVSAILNLSCLKLFILLEYLPLEEVNNNFNISNNEAKGNIQVSFGNNSPNNSDSYNSKYYHDESIDWLDLKKLDPNDSIILKSMYSSLLEKKKMKS